MRKFAFCMRIVAILSLFTVGNVRAQNTARLVKTEMVWAGEKHIVGTDLVRFKDAWMMACCENSKADQQDGVLRIITSKDSLPWESLAIVESPTQGKLLSRPRLSVQPDGLLMLTAIGIVPNPQATQPLPKFGGTVQTLAWSSVDGRTWSQFSPIGNVDFIQGNSVWHKNMAFSYTRGCICGNAQTIKIMSGVDQKGMKAVYTETVAEFFPDEASLLFTGGQGFCFMSRVGDRGEFQTALLGIAKEPFKDWQWKETNSRDSFPNFLRLADDRVLVVGGLLGKHARISICRLNLATGELTELLEIPTGGSPTHTGASFHDGKIWLCFISDKQGKKSAYLAEIVVE